MGGREVHRALGRLRREGIPEEEEFNEHRPNNYYLYSDSTGRFSMLPWGTDQTWNERLEFDGQDGRLFDLCLEDETCAGLFSTAVADALEKVGGLDLGAQAAATEAMLRPWQALEEDPRKPYDADQIAAAVEGTRDFIAERPAEAEAWLNGTSPPPIEAAGADDARPQRPPRRHGFAVTGIAAARTGCRQAWRPRPF